MKRLSVLLLVDEGDALVTQGDLPNALASYRKSLAMREKLAAAEPSSAEAQRNLFVSLNKVGNALVGQGEVPYVDEFRTAVMEMAVVA